MVKDLRVVFLGTASCFPTPSRGVSCIALQRSQTGEIWLFDCGEGSQIQIQKCSKIKPGKINKIFITHLHGDHLFGLPGLLCTLGNNLSETDDKIVDIYGPLGLRKYVQTSLEVSQSSVVTYQLRIHELVPKPDQYLDPDYKERILEHYSGGKNTIEYDEQLKGWKVFQDPGTGLKVFAGALRHRVPSFGFIVQEPDKPGSLDVAKLREKYGIKPGPIYGDIKKGIPVTLEDGTVVKPEDVTGAVTPGLRVAVFGDTCDASEMANIVCDEKYPSLDLLIHEATMENKLREKCVEFGHSTPAMAVEFAVKIGAKRLCLTHLSPRYKPICDEDDELSAAVLLEQAKNTPNNLQQIMIAQDFYEIEL